MIKETEEGKRLDAASKKDIPLPLWGPYLSERQWGTVREDYSENGQPWTYFPHDHARSRAYLWGEDGIAGISDYGQNICFALAFWNGKDPILKERLFGLANGEGNHGEDVKELYYYLDNIPSHYYMKYLYKLPQNNYPYNELIERNKAAGKQDEEVELLDTDCLKDGNYFDVHIEYAKAGNRDIHIQITATNYGTETAPITILPTIWFYNRWQYGGLKEKPSISKKDAASLLIQHERLNDYELHFPENADVLFTENETNFEKLFQRPNHVPFTKDAFHDAIISGKDYDTIKAVGRGTKACVVQQYSLAPGESKSFTLRLVEQRYAHNQISESENIFEIRKAEADAFYGALIPTNATDEEKNIQRQAFAGLMWNKQYYHYDVLRWLQHTDGITPVSEQRLTGRNSRWRYLKNQDVMLMPDKWEYPWYAAWDTAFQCIAIGLADPVFAKHQLILLMREWFMSPNGQLPAYEWDFNDINPPVHAFAALQVYNREREIWGRQDLDFLKNIFQKLIINFTWWVNKTDTNGNNVFEGGFLGLDNIGVFNRSRHVPDEVILDQADATSWVGMYALNMMEIAIEIATHDPAFEDSATKFYEHFVIIAEALNSLGLWNENDNFFYDILTVKTGNNIPLKVRSVVGITPIYDVGIITSDNLRAMPDFEKRMHWFKSYREQNNLYMPNTQRHDKEILLSLVKGDRLGSILESLLNEDEFLAPGGIRSVSKCHKENPFEIELSGEKYSLQYDPGDSTSNMFGGNSNWRGPVWMPINYLIITALKKYASFYGEELKLEFPSQSGNTVCLKDISAALTQRLMNIFKRDENGNRPVFGRHNAFYKRPENQELILFYEYYHGDDSHGLGASHQTGWTAVILDLLRDN